MTATLTARTVKNTDSEAILINPTLGDVCAELEDKADRADHGQRARRLQLDALRALGESDWASECAVHEWGGDGVANAYRDRATTSVAGVVWFTAPNGDRHVRIKADRVGAPKSAFGRRSAEAFYGLTVDSPTCDFISAVYQGIYTPETLLVKNQKGRKADRWSPVKIALHQAIAANMLDEAAWAALADWYTENDEHYGHSRALQCRESLAAVRAIIHPEGV